MAKTREKRYTRTHTLQWNTICSHLEHYWSVTKTAATQPVFHARKIITVCYSQVMSRHHTAYPQQCKTTFFYTARRAAFRKNYLQCYRKEIATGSQKIIWAMPERHLWTKIISSTISKWPHKQIWSRFGIKGLLKQTMTTFRMLHYTAIWL